jgi:ribosomal protein L23
MLSIFDIKIIKVNALNSDEDKKKGKDRKGMSEKYSRSKIETLITAEEKTSVVSHPIIIMQHL